MTPRITRITSATFTGKTFLDAGDGSLKKIVAGTVFAGQADTLPAPSATALAAILSAANAHTALVLGTLKGNASTARLTTAAKQQSGSVARTQEFFEFRRAAPGWLLLDYDNNQMPQDVASRITQAGGPVAAMESIWPALRQAARVYRPSSSGGVHLPGKPPAEASGFHLFVMVQDVARSADILKALHEAAWAAGFGWWMISASGVLLSRSIIDATVGSPERLVFIAPPILGPGVLRATPALVAQDGPAAAYPPPTDQEAVLAAMLAARKAATPAADKAAEAWLETRIDAAVAAAPKLTRPTARKTIMAMMQGGILADDTPLWRGDGSPTTAAALLRGIKPGHHEALPSPTDGPEYGLDKATLRWAIGHPEPAIVSHAHGHRTIFRFARYQPGGCGAADTPPVNQITKVPRAMPSKAARDAARAFQNRKLRSAFLSR